MPPLKGTYASKVLGFPAAPPSLGSQMPWVPFTYCEKRVFPKHPLFDASSPFTERGAYMFILIQPCRHL